MRLGVISAGLLSFAVLCSSQSCLKSQEESRIHTTTHTESVTLSLPSMPTTGFSELSWKWADKVFRMRNLSIPIESDAVTYFPNGTLVLREPSVRHSGNIELEVYNHTGHCIFRGTVTLHVQDEISFGGVSTTTVNNFSKENSVMPNPQGNTLVTLFLLSACGSLLCAVIFFLVILNIVKHVQHAGRKNSQRGGSCIFFNSKPKREDEYVNMEPDPFSVVMRQTGRCSTEPLLTQNAKQGTPASSSAEPRHDVYAQINFQSKEKGSARRGFSPSLDSTASD
ncbi:uncharacterized protein LOC125751187 isoform X2 [Brienomyrus brachyistius]|uniref:uncharacterized protein LOC125751187 isoform X2 n=1 Tax=Brienomyrus brachyistius TaxID=42636 RepID=UPI0020B26685|nr:uncharacterized protein LOC125751187 isoform X2 [Brienomyrus brachyistius]